MNSDPSLEKMTRRVQHITGLLSSSKLGQSDNFMCGNYGIGGHYGVHGDYNAYWRYKARSSEHLEMMAPAFCATFE